MLPSMTDDADAIAKQSLLVNAVSPVADTRMGAGVYPDYFRELIRPELVSAAVVYLASEECASSGDVITAAAGYYAKAQVVESAGFAFPPQEEVTPEMFAERYGEINKQLAELHTEFSNNVLADEEGNVYVVLNGYRTAELPEDVDPEKREPLRHFTIPTS